MRSHPHALVAALLLATPCAALAQTTVTEADDAYHFQDWQGSPHESFYTEWWYFNLYDTANDLQAIFTYQVANPAGLSGLSVADITAVVYHGKQIIPETDIFPLTGFTASNTAADVAIGANKISVSDPSTYNLSGSTNDGRLSWNLQYRRDAASWFAADHVNVAPAPWEKMSWLVYMPDAHVTGTLTVDGQTYNLDCSGYHDHNWGQWNFEKVLWNWAQYSQPGMAFDLGDFHAVANGRAAVEVSGKRYVFSAAEYTLTHTKWAFDQQDNIPYPMQSVFAARNDNVQVQLTLDIQRTQPLLTGPPPSLVIYEQTAHYTGSITANGQSPVTIDGDGFAEYTSITKP